MRLTTAKKQPATRRRTQPRKRVVPLWRRRSALAGIAIMLLTSALAYGWWAWRAGVPHRVAEDARQAVVQRSLAMGFIVNEVFVEGRKNTPAKALRKALAIERGAPILFVDLDAARERLLALPWVSDVSVQRVLPDTVVVHLVERRPMALWQHDGRFALIDETGAVLERDNLGRFADLVVIVGDQRAATEAAGLLAILATETDLSERVTAAVSISQRRWNLRFANGLNVQMPEENLAEGWRRLAEYDRRHGLLGLGLQSIDLRLPDRVVVRPLPGSDTPKEARKKNA
ncbi:MAG: FtsQ-type POTRA domain-containing protein [Rhodospirillales bacterium]|nr:FtsQ-type POTRA domain-containing protein [Rhodospirillales bacterium]